MIMTCLIIATIWIVGWLLFGGFLYKYIADGPCGDGLMACAECENRKTCYTFISFLSFIVWPICLIVVLAKLVYKYCFKFIIFPFTFVSKIHQWGLNISDERKKIIEENADKKRAEKNEKLREEIKCLKRENGLLQKRIAELNIYNREEILDLE